MTTPDERYRSLKAMMLLVEDILKDKTIDETYRNRAYYIMRHNLDDFHLDLICEQLPDYFAKEFKCPPKTE